MKSTRTAMALALFAALAAPAVVVGQQSDWQPTVAAAPVANPLSGSPQNYVWQPAVYGSPAPAVAPAHFAGYSAAGGDDCTACSSAGACQNCGSYDCGCGDWLSERFGVYGLWGSVEFMHAWAQGRRVPPLVTTSPAGTPRIDAGVLDPGGVPSATASILFGGGRIGEDRQSAGRIVAGVWLDECENLGAGVRLFGLEGDNTGFNQFSDANGNPILAVPFFNVQNNAEDSVLAAFPGQLSGGITVNTSQDVLSGESFLRALLLRGNGYRVDLIGGYHYSQVSDGLDVIVDTIAIDPGGFFPIGSNFVITDRFDVRNDFHGAVGGFMGELRHGCWRVHTLAKISVGNMREALTVSGSTVATVPGGGTAVDDFGLFAQPSNIGTFSRDETAYIPEANLGLGYQLNDCLELTVGYTFVYWSNVLLAGDQIDRVVDLSGTGTRPAIELRDSDFWVQGVTLGANWNY